MDAMDALMDATTVAGGSTRDDEPILMIELATELQVAILQQLPSFIELSRCARTCKAWHALHTAVARQTLESLSPSLDASICPRPLRALAAAERLVKAVGIPRPSLTWIDEWPVLRVAGARARAYLLGTVESFDAHDFEMLVSFCKPGNDGSIEHEADHAYRSSVSFKVANGWDRDHAVRVSLLASRCGNALSMCVQSDNDGGSEGMERIRTPGLQPLDTRYAASCWALCTALWEQTWLEHSHVAPPTFIHLDGEFGLASEDRGWEAIRGPGGDEPGTRFLARGFSFAHVGTETCFPDGRRFYVPVTTSFGVTYEPTDSDVVRFLSRPPTASAYRSLLWTDIDVYRLPPFVTVTLEAVWQPGEWSIEGMGLATSTTCKCYDCYIEY